MVKPVARHWFHTRDIPDPSECKLKGGLSSTEQVLLEGIVWRKLDRRLIPLCTILFLILGVDQGNIGNARVVGMQASLGISNYQFSIALTATCAAYLAALFPTALLLKHVGPHIMLPSIALLSGVISVSQGFVSSFPGFLACRIFLGLTQGGVFSAIVLYLSLFYPRKRLQLHIGTLTAAVCMSGAFSGLLAASISRIDSKSDKPGWTWIFILEGMFTIIFGIACFPLFPRSPERTSFLTEKEREYVVSVLKHAGSVSEDDNEDKFSSIELFNAFKSPQAWFLALPVFCSGTIQFSSAFFVPTVVDGLGYAGHQAQIMSAPPFMAAFVAVLVSSVVCDRYRCRGCAVTFFSVVQLVGLILFHACASDAVRYASLFLSVPGASCASPALIAWASNDGPRYARDAAAVASMSVGSVIISVVNMGYLWRENRSKEKRGQNVQKENEPRGLGDRSAWFTYSL